MGWLALGLIGAGAAVALALAGLPRRLRAFAGAALMLGAIGYALQGRPMLPGKSVSTARRGPQPDPGLFAFRDAVLRPDPAAARVLHAADDRLARDDARGAVDLLLQGIDARPRDPALWAALGSAMSANDGRPSPPAMFAFRRAVALGPREPGPPFLLGLAWLEAGDLPATDQAWAQAIALAPADAPYRATLKEQLLLVRRFRAMTEAAR